VIIAKTAPSYGGWSLHSCMVIGNQLIAVFSQLSWCMGYIADYARKFFHSAAINDMLSTFAPLIDGASLDVGANLSYIYFCPDLFLKGSYLLNTTSRLICPSPTLKAIFQCYSVCGNPSTRTSMMNLRVPLRTLFSSAYRSPSTSHLRRWLSPSKFQWP